MRLVEYYAQRNSPMSKVLCGIYKYILRHYSRKTGYQIPPGTCGFGLKILHWGTVIVNSHARLGRNVTLYPGCVIGQTELGKVPVVGDNVYIGLGAKVFGDVRVGNNVTIAPNAIVTKDVPDNAVVGGIPARVIKMKS